ncbi:MAG TPA: hypothetical protein VIC59_02290 [Gemmatimonadota bacterium]|jgi:hypothetical protein
MNALRRHLTLLAIFSLVRLLSGCSDGSSGPADLSANPGACQDDQDEPGDIDNGDEEDDDGPGDDDAGECDDD